MSSMIDPTTSTSNALPSTTAPTTLILPDGYTPYIAYAAGDVPYAVQTTAGPTIASAGGFILYLPANVTKNANVSSLIQNVNSGTAPDGLNAWHSATTIADLASLSADEEILIPVGRRLGERVTVANLKSSLNINSDDLQTTSGPSQTGQPPVSTTASNAGATTSSPKCGINSTTNTTEQAKFNGAVAGGTIGGFVLGALACCTILLCCLKRRNAPSRKPYGGRSGSNDIRAIVTSEKTPRTIESSMSATGWQKHLPPEEGDRKIENTFQNLYHLIQMHIDGYYGDKAAGLSNEEATASLKLISEDGIHDETADSGILLQAILTRWIIHRISLRSSSTESLLPYEYTRIPETCNWNMERSGQRGLEPSDTRKGTNIPTYSH